MDETGFDPRYLELELTESALMSEGGDAETLLNQLKITGVRLAIDDSAQVIRPCLICGISRWTRLKIDKSFVRDIPDHQDDMEIATAIIQLAHILGFTVLAEGVEKSAQLDFLRKQGCDLYQGYLFNKPMPAEAFLSLLQTTRDYELSERR